VGQDPYQKEKYSSTERLDRRPISLSGLMDVISVIDMNKHFRVMPSHKGLVLQSIEKEEANFKLARVEDRRTLPEGVQVSLHDGSNILVKIMTQKSC